MREAVGAIAAAAAPSAAIVSDAPNVVVRYLMVDRRPDVAARSLSEEGLSSDGRETWVIVQDEHTTFENQLLIEQLRARETAWMEVRVGETLAAQVFRIGAR